MSAGATGRARDEEVEDMSEKLFGTDGVRGEANSWPMTAEMALQLGAAAGRFFRRDQNEHRVVIGKDTRLSGYMIENALVLVVTHTDRAGRTRIISARPGSRAERSRYEQALRQGTQPRGTGDDQG